MSLDQLKPQEKIMLAQASPAVVQLYQTDVWFETHGIDINNEPIYRDRPWEETAVKFPPFTDKIRNLSAAFKAVRKIKRNYPQEPFMIQVLMNFHEITDLETGLLLSKLLLARIADREPGNEGHILYDREWVQESLDMAREMGFEGGWADEQAKTVDKEQIFSAYLAGALSIPDFLQQ